MLTCKLTLVGQLGAKDARWAEVKNVGVVDVNITGSGCLVGSLVGSNDGSVIDCHSSGAVSGDSGVGGLVGDNSGTVSRCRSQGAVNGTGGHVGGLVGYNCTGIIATSYSTSSVIGTGENVGGLVGRNDGGVTQCCSAGTVSGDEYVGGLVGFNFMSDVMDSYSTGAVNGSNYVGGLVGWNGYSDVAQCYSTGAVDGNDSVGGLVGENWGTVTQSYSTGEVTGNDCVGGLVGKNYESFGRVGADPMGRIFSSYSTGMVMGTGEYVGGLVGEDTFCRYVGWEDVCFPASNVIQSFWDIETSGQATSAGGTGKTTDEMQTAKTFLDAGWDFVGETANGTEDIWKIAEGLGYPRLSWEKYSGGTGEPNDPYQIATAADLIALGETPEDYVKHFILTADIDLDPNLPGRKVFDRAVIAPDMDPTNSSWVFDGTPFTGVFDGNGHTISHLTITGKDYLGLFGQSGHFGIVPPAEIRDLGVIDVNIVGSGEFVGGLVGLDVGIVTRCYSTGLLSGSLYVGGLVGLGSATDCYSTAAVSGKDYVGGLVGSSGGVIQCFSAGPVNGTGWAIGGLVGYNDGFVSQCYSTGAVDGNDNVGGLVGCNEGWLMTQCYSTGAVSGNGYVGGLVGSGDTNDVSASFWDTQTSGQITSAGGTGKTTAEMQDPNTFMTVGWDFVNQADGPDDIWAEPTGGGYPILWWQLPPLQGLPMFSGGTGEPNDPYRISTAAQLNSIGQNPRLMKCHFKLTHELDLAGFHFYPIGGPDYPYAGVFDGDGHTISRLAITGTNLVGLFGQLEPGAEVRDLGVVDVNVVASGYYTAGLVGENYGTVSRCYCTGLVSGNHYIGGLVGRNHGHVSYCYSTGSVIGNSRIGGLVGSGPPTNVTACFWDIETSGQATSAGGTGKTTTEMQTASTFLDAGWDFVDETANGTEDIWWILEGQDYPRLWWEAIQYDRETVGQ